MNTPSISSTPTPVAGSVSNGMGNEDLRFREYKALVHHILSKAPPQQRQLYSGQIDQIVRKLINLSQTSKSFLSLVTNPNLSSTDKRKAIGHGQLSEAEINQLLQVSQFPTLTPTQQRNYSSFMGNSPSSESMNLPNFMTNYLTYIPSLMMQSAGQLFSFFTGVASDQVHKEFSEPIDIIYMALFTFASVPFFGVIADFLIIVRALMENKVFLALLTTYTVFISLFQYHFFDMGIVFKMFYGLDSFSHANDRRMRKKMGVPLTGKVPHNYLSQHQAVYSNQYQQQMEQQHVQNTNQLQNLLSSPPTNSRMTQKLNELKSFLNRNNFNVSDMTFGSKATADLPAEATSKTLHMIKNIQKLHTPKSKKPVDQDELMKHAMALQQSDITNVTMGI